MKDCGRLEGLLEQAVHDAAYWPEVCQEVAVLLGGRAAAFIAYEPEFRGIWLVHTSNMNEAVAEYIEKEWYLNDYRQKTAEIVLARGYASDDDLFENRNEMDFIPYYDFVRRHNVGFYLGFNIPTPTGQFNLSVYFKNDQPPVTAEQIEIIERIRPRLIETVALADENAHREISSFAGFFRESDTRIYVLDPQGDHCLTIDESGNLYEDNTLLHLMNAPLAEDLKQRIEHACASDPKMSASFSHQVNRNGVHYNLTTIQVPPRLRHFHMPLKVCVVLTKESDQKDLRRITLKDRFKLTDSEMVTVELLVAGNKPKDIADFLSLKTTTIRQRLKVVFGKTRVQSQVALISLYNTL